MVKAFKGGARAYRDRYVKKWMKKGRTKGEAKNMFATIYGRRLK